MLQSNFVGNNENVLIGKSVGYTLKNLREIENKSALKIQRFVRKVFTRKWYLNFLLRKRLSMPFSGLEITQNAFLRQFHRINLKLHQGLASAGMAEVIKMEQDERRNMVFSWKQEKPGIKVIQSPSIKRGFGKPIKHPHIAMQTAQVQPKKKFVKQKGKTAEQLLEVLKEDFINSGLDAYSQFKRLGAGVVHTETGFPYAESGAQRQIQQLIRETRQRPVPEWIADKNNNERANIDPSVIFFEEPKEYMQRTEGKAFASRGDYGAASKNTSSAMIMHQFRTKPPSVRSSDRQAGEETKIESELTDDNMPDELFGPEGYQTYSREPIVFHKMFGPTSIKWTTVVGNAFRPSQDSHIFIPVKIIGQPMHSRSTVVTHIINLELLDISIKAARGFTFETIWPFILYVFNNWIKHQVRLMGVKRLLPSLLTQHPELAGRRDNVNFKFIDHKDLEDDIEALEDEQFRNMLDFSSELELDEKHNFDFEQPKIDRSSPAQFRPTIAEVRKNNRRKMFDQYWNSLQDVIEDKELDIDDEFQRELHVANDTITEEQGHAGEQKLDIISENQRRKDRSVYFNPEISYIKPGTEPKKSALKGRNINKQVGVRPKMVTASVKDKFMFFLESQFVYMPKEKSKAFQLAKAMQGIAYHLLEKQGGLSKLSIAFLNEERRKRRKLPPLSNLDYNCMDRASIKIKKVLDSLQLDRTIVGTRLVPCNLKQQHLMKTYQVRVNQENYETVVKLDLQLVSRTIPQMMSQKLMIAQNEQQTGLINSVHSNSDIVRISSQQSSQLGQQDSYQNRNSGQERLALERYQEEALQLDLQKFKLKRERTEIETILEDLTILEQGCIRFNQRIFMANLFFRKISSNVDNMIKLIHQRENKYIRQPSLEQSGNDKIDVYKLMDLREKHQRHVSRLCDLISENVQVLTNDNLALEGFDELSKYECRLEMAEKERTQYESYCEIKVFTKLSTTPWEDNVVVSWESITKFFAFFGHVFDVVQFMKDRRFKRIEAFLFYRFLPECLALDSEHWTDLVFDLKLLNAERLMYDQIYLEFRKLNWTKQKYDLHFYFTDILKATKFDADRFDELEFPFFQDPAKSHSRVFKLTPEIEMNLRQDAAHEQNPSAKLNDEFEMGEKPEILVDDNTREFLSDPNHLFNLTLTNYPKSITIYLGRLYLSNWHNMAVKRAATSSIAKHSLYSVISQGAFQKRQSIERSQKNLRNKQLFFESAQTAINREGDGRLSVFGGQLDLFNVRIDYFVTGLRPTLLIKATQSVNSQQVHFRTSNQQHIKAIIRICGQSQHKMVLNQLQSLITVILGTNGRKLMLNFDKRQSREQQMVANLYTMLAFNEQLLQDWVGPQNYRQFKQMMNLSNVTPFTASLMVQLTEYQVEIEMMQHTGDLLMQIVHGNKHLTSTQLLEARERILIQKQGAMDSGLKVLRIVKVWKIALFNMRQSKHYECVLTQQDLEHYYEAEVFKFFKTNPHVARPPLTQLLEDYLLNIYSHRTPVGTTLAWNLPQYKKPLNSYGLPISLPKDQYFNFEELSIYKRFKQMLNLAIKRDDEMNILPISLDTVKQKQTMEKLPQLALKTRLLIERVLPIYQRDDFMALRLTSTQQKILANKVKVFKSLSASHFALVTVTLHDAMECWIWTLYFPITQRTFIATFYSSDLLNVNQDLFKNIDFVQTKRGIKPAQKESLIWQKLIEISSIEANKLGDMILVVDSFREPIREQLFQSYVYNETASDIFYMEVTVKSYANYVTDATNSFPSVNLQDTMSKELTVQLKGFSLTRNIWIKDYQPLTEVIRLLRQESLLHQDIRNFYYSMLRNAAIILAHKVVFSKHARTVEVKKRAFKYDVTQQIIARADPQPQKEESKTTSQKLQTVVPTMNTEWQNIVQLNRIIYQQTVAINPTQICTISYNEAKDIFVLKLYRPVDSTTVERRIAGNQIQRACAPYYLQMLRKGMEQELGERISQYYYTNLLIVSVMQANSLQGLSKQYTKLSSEIEVDSPKKTVQRSPTVQRSTSVVRSSTKRQRYK